MKAAILLTGASSLSAAGAYSPGDYSVRAAAMACASMGIDVVYRAVDGTNPTIANVNAYWDVDLIIVPRYTSTLRPTFQRFCNHAGGVSVTICPVFVLSINFWHASMFGSSAAYDGTAVFAISQHRDSGAAVPTNTRRLTYDTGLIAPEASKVIVAGTGDDEAAMTSWRYTPDGSAYVYFTSSSHRFCHLHILMQDAINLGILDPPPHPAPLLLNIDHINDDGEPAHVGGIGGWQENPARVGQVGAVLRKYGGIAYTSMEVRYIDGTKGTTDGELLSNLLACSDVFRICASHNHGQYYTTEADTDDDPISNQTAKSTIGDDYATTKAAIEALGLTVSADFLHFAGNRAGTNVWELASPDVSVLSDPDGLVAQAGWNAKMARIGLTVASWPHRSSRVDTDPIEAHWLFARNQFRGLTFVNSEDAGDDSNSDGSEANATLQKWNMYSHWLQALTSGFACYFHAEDFEDVAWRTANLEGAPTTSSGGVAVEQYGLDVFTWLGALGAYCSDTIDFGADVSRYL